jgi:hypothetical protein
MRGWANVERKAKRKRRIIENGELRMENGEWRIENGELRMEN